MSGGNKKQKKKQDGYISAVVGSLIKIRGLENNVRLHDLINVSKYNILGEVIQIYSNHIVVQTFENTTNVKLYDRVVSLNEPFSMELGPGLLSNVFDGLQRPLGKVFENFISGTLERGIRYPSLSRTKTWSFIPQKKINDIVKGGDTIGFVKETSYLEHKIMVPPDVSGVLTFIVNEGDYTIVDEIFRLMINNTEKSFTMMQKWPITEQRPYSKKLDPDKPLITGIRAMVLMR